jgi:hypothetical protein
MFKKSLFVVLGWGMLSIFAISTCAMNESPPKKCPTLSALKAVRLNVVQLEKETEEYAAFIVNAYGSTTHRWLFYIEHIKATDKNDALKKANDALPSLGGGQSKPYHDGGNGVYFCPYTIGSGYVAGAVTRGQPIPAERLHP